MAKGIGNGFPMGAVVTTEEIAASFGKALYFNTFGGIQWHLLWEKLYWRFLILVQRFIYLQVIEEEKLQENCAVVGDYFLKQLASIDSPLIGDVRGKGLMIGMEFVDEDGHPLPAARMANIFERVKL
ncbi:hypothetical protein OESDEN_21976 [Oesophagostomum dentatum]|uniref:Alanine--glyoxylate aminotransferase 2, mitochondrial n=1 Tax=Oesophagostomum dentatum TaxID=61180 RepID=A0A0B1RZ82_OESDE|nr:hypothetical protein OESDEN_21976 [Oesophagostomum dentatum]